MLRALLVALTLLFLVASPASIASIDRQKPKEPHKTIFTRTLPTIGGRVAGD
jgi:hypothetical protein